MKNTIAIPTRFSQSSFKHRIRNVFAFSDVLKIIIYASFFFFLTTSAYSENTIKVHNFSVDTPSNIRGVIYWSLSTPAITFIGPPSKTNYFYLLDTANHPVAWSRGSLYPETKDKGLFLSQHPRKVLMAPHDARASKTLSRNVVACSVVQKFKTQGAWYRSIKKFFRGKMRIIYFDNATSNDVRISIDDKALPILASGYYGQVEIYSGMHKLEIFELESNTLIIGGDLTISKDNDFYVYNISAKNEYSLRALEYLVPARVRKY